MTTTKKKTKVKSKETTLEKMLGVNAGALARMVPKHHLSPGLAVERLQFVWKKLQKNPALTRLDADRLYRGWAAKIYGGDPDSAYALNQHDFDWLKTLREEPHTMPPPPEAKRKAPRVAKKMKASLR